MTGSAQAVFDVCVTLKQQLALDLAGSPGGTPDRAVVMPVSIPWDACECGMLAIAVGSQWITETFPANMGDVTTTGSTAGCHAGFLAANVVVQIIRCAPQPVDNELFPPIDELEASALEVLADGWIVLNETECLLAALKDSEKIVDYLIRGQTFEGPEGGCVGSELTVTIAVDQAA